LILSMDQLTFFRSRPIAYSRQFGVENECELKRTRGQIFLFGALVVYYAGSRLEFLPNLPWAVRSFQVRAPAQRPHAGHPT
jgi:hypothetical protein